MRPKSAAKLREAWKGAQFYTGRPSTNSHDQINLRLVRALSWLERAEQETRKDPPDADAAFMFLWIAFDALSSPQLGDMPSDDQRRQYFERMVVFTNAQSVIYDAIWSVLQDDIRSILENKYVFQPFWDNRNDPLKSPDWKAQFDDMREKVEQHLLKTRTRDVLIELFRRLNTLRNQLFHGGAKWKSKTNRPQVKPGAKIMATLVPHFIYVMIRYPDGGWDAPRYPVVEETGPQSGWTDNAGNE